MGAIEFNEKIQASLKSNAEEFKIKMAVLLHDSEIPLLNAMTPENAVIAVEIRERLKDFRKWAKEQLKLMR